MEQSPNKDLFGLLWEDGGATKQQKSRGTWADVYLWINEKNKVFKIFFF